MDKMWYMYTMEYYSAIKKNEILSFAATWMDLEIIILSEVSQTKTNIISLICGIKKKIKQINILQNRNRFTDIKNQFMVTKREKGGGGIN